MPEHECIQIGGYFLAPGTPPDAVAIVREQAQWERDWRLIQAARERIANGTAGPAAVALQADADAGREIDPAEPLPPPEVAPEPRVRPHEWRGRLMNTLLPDGYRTMRERMENPQWKQARVNALRPGQKGKILPLPLLGRDMVPVLKADGTLIRRMLDTGAISVTYAPSNLGKSFFMVDLALHVATGMGWRGFKVVKPGPVLYFALEGGGKFVNRYIAARRHYGFDDDADIPFALMRCPIDLFDPNGDGEQLIASIDYVECEYNCEISMVVIDTLARAIGSGDENSTRDMSAFIRNIDIIRDACGAHIAIVHHTGKDQAKGARGSYALKAGIDTEIELIEQGDPNERKFAVAIHKQRDMDKCGPFVCSLKTVEIGIDDDGAPVTSAVIEHLINETAQPDRGNATDPNIEGLLNETKDIKDKALDVLIDLIEAEGEELPPSDEYELGTRGVLKTRWREACDLKPISGAQTDEARRSAFTKAAKKLEDAGHITVIGKWIMHRV
jgi:hypothetical protein